MRPFDPPETPPESPAWRDWPDLDEEAQTRLQIAYGHYLDSLPPTCSLETKIERFRRWLADQGIRYPGGAGP